MDKERENLRIYRKVREDDAGATATIDDLIKVQERFVAALEQLEQAREALLSVTHQAGAEDIDEYCVVARGLDFGSYEQGFSAAVEIIRRRCRKALEQQQEVG